MAVFLCYKFEGHIFGGAYFWNFTVLQFILASSLKERDICDPPRENR